MPTKRRVFYSFHYARDSWRSAQVRNMGVIEGNQPAADNDWEEVKRGGDAAIERWIAGQMKGRSCTVVLVGTHTAARKWIDHEITETWNAGMGLVGVRIHGLQNQQKLVSEEGPNPFAHLKLTDGRRLSSVVKCYNPPGGSSKERYDWIQKYLAFIVEQAIASRGS